MSKQVPVKVNDVSFLPAPVAVSESLLGDSYLGRLQLASSNSNIAKSGEIPVNHFALIENKKPVDLGKTVDIFVLASRAKALDINDGVVESFEEGSELFNSIRSRAPLNDSGCMFGPEYLVYLPSKKKFSALFMSNASNRREAALLEGLMRSPATLSSYSTGKGKKTWQVITATTCTTPFELPAQADILVEYEKFLNPVSSKASENETVEDTASRAR